MGLGLWHNSATPALQSQLPSGRENLPRLSHRVHFFDEASSGEARSARSQADLGAWQLHRGGVTIGPLLSKRIVKSSGKLGHNGRRIVACAAGGSGESGERFFGCSSVFSDGALLWQPLWSNVVKFQRLDFGGNGIGGGHGNGGQGGGGSSGGDGSGSGKVGHETHVSSVGERDEEHACRESPAMRSRVLLPASLSSATGDSVEGQAPFALFGSSLFGRWNRPGAADETAANVTSKTIGSQGVSGGQFSGMENKRGVSEEVSAAHAVQKDGDEASAKRSETAALRRLQRETFEDLMRVRERLDKLEFQTGLRKSKAQSPVGEGAAKTRLTGEVCAGGAFLLLDDESSRYSRAALAEGLHTGVNARFTFETFYREKDVMITECSARHSGSDGSVLGGPISVTKLVYNARVTDDIDVVVAPLGARVSDLTETVNPLQGQALTQFARIGPAMYRHCAGSALGATLKGTIGLISLSQCLSSWGSGSSLANEPLGLSTLAHVLFQPWENSVFSLSAVNRFCINPSVRGLRWSEIGPLVLSKARHTHNSGSISPQMSSSGRSLRTSVDNASLGEFRTASSGASSNSASWGTPYGEAEQTINAAPQTHGSATQSIALAGEIDVGENVSLAGWAQADRGSWFDEPEKKEIEWGVSLAKAAGKTVAWGLCVGNSKVDLWSAARNEDNTVHGIGDGSGYLQLHMEAFMKLSVGRGFILQPGLVYLRNKQSQTPALMLRSSWAL